MAVYVDELAEYATDFYPWRHVASCHMYADTVSELYALADRIGLKRRWFQNKPSFPHYDLLGGNKRRAAIRAGAIETNRAHAVEHVRALRGAKL